MIEARVDTGSTSFQVGEVFGTTALIVVGALLIVRGMRRQHEARDGHRGSGLIGIGGVLAILGAAMTALQFVPTSTGGGDNFTDDLKDARAYVSHHDVSVDGRVKDAGTVIDVGASYKGGAAEGELGIRGANAGFRWVDGETYIQFTESLLRASLDDMDISERPSDAQADELIAAASGAWDLIDEYEEDMTNKESAAINRFSSRDWIFDIIPSEGTFRLGEPRVIRGVRCVRLDDRSNDVAIYLAKSDHRPMRASHGGTEYFDFNWSHVASIAAPKPDELLPNVLKKAGFLMGA